MHLLAEWGGQRAPPAVPSRRQPAAHLPFAGRRPAIHPQDGLKRRLVPARGAVSRRDGRQFCGAVQAGRRAMR